MSLRRESCIMPTQLALLRFRLPQPVRHELHRSTDPSDSSKKILWERGLLVAIESLIARTLPQKSLWRRDPDAWLHQRL